MKRREKHEGFVGQRLVVLPRPILATAIRHPLLKHLLPTDAGYYPKARGHVCARERGCPEVIFIYCAEGNGWCELAGRRHDIAKNQLLAIPAATPHIYGAAKKAPWTIHWFHVVGTNVPYYLEQLGVSLEQPVVSLGGDVQLFSLFEDLLEGLQHGFTATHLIYSAHSLAHLMGLILRHKEEFWHGETSVRDRIDRNIQFMKSHLREPLTVAALATLANLSRSHYTTLFRRVTGYAPLNYLNHLRMQRAVELLNTTDWPIKQIS
ncbi:MAG: AraC family transcriptional regulator, partial [Verrucomicrobia bacterium]|nr:AraC family transcriptional regulator [Verrucomicrobiota bacterium]